MVAAAALVFCACSDASSPSASPAAVEPQQEPPDEAGGDLELAERDTSVAAVVAVEVRGEAGDYVFTVTVSSPDTGCDRYADWWEVIDLEGGLIYRRVLLHSHVTEQPFSRSGGPVAIAEDAVVWVRAHMNPGGYGGAAFQGSVGGFAAGDLDPTFADAVSEQPPLPDGCDF